MKKVLIIAGLIFLATIFWVFWKPSPQSYQTRPILNTATRPRALITKATTLPRHSTGQVAGEQIDINKKVQVEPTSSQIPSTEGTEPSPEIINETLVKIVRVVDGDTVDIDLNGSIERVRLIGIDTPELNRTANQEGCFGEEARNRLTALALGKFLRIETDDLVGERDKYNRLLRYLFTGDENIGHKLIIEGLAREYTYKTPYYYQSQFKEAEKEAEAAGIGLWASGACASQPKLDSKDVVKVPVATDDKDCKDFSVQAEAQQYFDAKGGSPLNNVDRLDSDHDGQVCESLP